MEQISDDRLIPEQMLVPGFFSLLFFFLVWVFDVHFNEGFLAFAVKVFSHEVQDGIDALMRVLLSVACECRVVFAKHPLEKLGRHSWGALVPHLAHQLGIRHRQPAFCTQRVRLALLLELSNETEFVIQVELCQLECVAEALERRVHVARVAEVR